MELAAVPVMKAVLVLAADGRRVYSAFFEPRLQDSPVIQAELEATLFQKTAASEAKGTAVVLHGDDVAVFQGQGDIVLYVLCSGRENELLAAHVLDTLVQSLALLLHSGTEAVLPREERPMISAALLFDNLNLLMLAIDEVLDDGLLLETDPHTVADRVLMTGCGLDPDTGSNATLASALQSAKQQFFRSFQ